MVYVRFREKFHGKMLKGTFLRRARSIPEARRAVKQWNTLTPRDKIIVKGFHKRKPKGFVKTKFKGIYKKR